MIETYADGGVLVERVTVNGYERYENGQVVETRPATDEELAAIAAADASSTVATGLATLVSTATVLLQDFIAHAQLPVANRSQVTAASLDARAGTLMVQGLSSTDPRIIGLTAKITALGLRLTRERDDYEAGLL